MLNTSAGLRELKTGAIEAVEEVQCCSVENECDCRKYGIKDDRTTVQRGVGLCKGALV